MVSMVLTPNFSMVYMYGMGKCVICRKGIRGGTYCEICGKLVEKGTRRKIKAKVSRKALSDSWKNGAFHCKYTGVVVLTDTRYKNNPRFLTFDHRTPRKGEDIVISAAIINDMKTDTSEKEFQRLVSAVFMYRTKGVVAKGKIFKLKHYKRT